MRRIIIFTICILATGCSTTHLQPTAAHTQRAVTAHQKPPSRSLTNIYQDEELAHLVTSRLSKHASLYQHSRFRVISLQRNILLLGQTANEQDKTRSGKIAGTVPGVKKVYNHLVIGNPLSAMQRSSDSWITTKIKTNMLTEKGLPSTQIKVVTENGVVYLMGVVSTEQSDTAADLARSTTGVKQVVRLFQTYDEKPKTVQPSVKKPTNSKSSRTP